MGCASPADRAHARSPRRATSRPHSAARRIRQRAEDRRLPHPCLRRPRSPGPDPVSPWRAVITEGLPEIATAAREQLPAGCVIDGELVVLRHSGVLEFAALQRRLGAGRRLARELADAQPASMVVFDLLAGHGEDLRSMPLSRRRQLLERVMANCRPPLQLTPQTRDHGRQRQRDVHHDRGRCSSPSSRRGSPTP